MKQFTNQKKSAGSHPFHAASVAIDQLIADKKKTLLSASSNSWNEKFKLWTAQAASLAMVALCAIIFSGVEKAGAQTFTPGNIAVFKVYSSTDSTGTILEINPSTWTVVDSFIIPVTGANPLRFTSAATSGFLANALNNTLLTVTGWDTITNATATPDITVGFKRGVGTLTNSYTSFALATTYQGVGSPTDNQTRGATSLDGINWYITDKGGIYIQGSSSPIVSTNSLSAKIFGNEIYFCQAGKTLAAVDSLNSGQTALVGLHGLANGDGNAQDFYMVSSGLHGSTFDILYIVEETSATVGQIDKYSLVSGSWTSNGTAATTWGSKSVLAQWNGSGANLYISSGTGATAGNSIYSVTDVAGYNATLNVSASINNKVYTNGSTAILKGIAFAPVCSTAPSSPMASSTNSPVCQGSTLSFTSSATGANSYSWSGPNGFTSSSQNPSILNAQPAATGTYTLTATNNCGSTATTCAAIVSASPSPTITAGGPTTFCQGDSVTLTSSAASSYSWSSGQSTSSITVSTAGTYSVTVTVTGCSGTSAGTVVTVTPNVTPSVSISGSPSGAICAGTSVTYSATPTNGGSSPVYQWYYNSSPVGTNNSTYTTTPSNNGDNITCTMTSNATCASPATVTSNQITITISGSLSPSISPASPAFCPGGSVTLDAGAGYSSYIWSNSGSTNIAVTETYNATTADTYTVTVTNSSGCSGTASVTVSASSNPSNPTITGATSFCAGSSTTLSAGSYFSYAWSDGETTSSITVTATGSNSYSVVVTNSSGCTASSSPVTVTSNPNPTPVITGALSFCQGGSTTLGTTLSYDSYSWSNGATTPTITVTASGSFSVTVTDNNTCTGSSSVVNVTANSLFVADSSSNVTGCYGNSNGVAVAVVTGGTTPYTYQWSNGATTTSISGVMAGSYSVIVTDNNGCTCTFKKLIDYWTFDNTLPLGGGGGINISPAGADYSTTGGASAVLNQVLTPSRDSILDNGSGGANVNLRTGYTTSPNGNNYARTRNPNNEELLKFEMPTTGYQNLVLSFAEEQSSAGKAVNLFSYSTTGVNGPFITTGLSITTYTPGLTWALVTIDLRSISEANNNPNFVFAIGNSVNTTSGNARYDNVTLEGDSILSGYAGNSVMITQPAPINTTVTASGPTTFCQGGSVTLTAPAASGNSYVWSNSAITSAITVSTSGSYSVTITNNGCSAASSLTAVTVNSPTTSSASATTCGSYTWNGTIYSATGTYTYDAGSTSNAAGCDSVATLQLTITGPCPATLSLNLFIQGYYKHLGSSTPMDNLGAGGCLYVSGVSSNPDEVDTVTISLEDPNTQSQVGASVKGILHTDGSVWENGAAGVIFPATAIGNNYYIRITHRSAIETWSGTPVTISLNTTYDFSTGNGQSYGDNMVAVDNIGGNNVYAFYNGDVADAVDNLAYAQDGVIESADYSLVENDYGKILFGYYPTDVTGDGVVESADLSLIEENYDVIIFAATPW